MTATAKGRYTIAIRGAEVWFDAPKANLNADGVVNILDLGTVANFFAKAQ